MIDQGFAETCQVFGMILFRGDLFHAGSPRGDTKVLRESSRAILRSPLKRTRCILAQNNFQTNSILANGTG